MKHLFLRRLLEAICLCLVFIISPEARAQVSLTTINSPYTQDFNSLISSGTSTTVPVGFSFVETGTASNTTLTAGTGSSTTGDTYSFGPSSGGATTERAFGGLQSGSLIPIIGASFVNNTGTTITSLNITYTGEEWRLGTANRVDRLDFQYSTTATNLTSVTGYTDVDALDFSTPNSSTVAAPLGSRDGNANENRTTITGTITGLSIAPGATFWIRYNDFNASGSDDGLAIDDFSLTPITCPAITATLTGSSTICTGSSTNLTANITSGADPFSLTYSDGTSNTVVANYAGGSNIMVSPTASTTYTIIAAKDANGCAASVSGSAVVTVNQPPSISNAGPSQTITTGTGATLAANAPGIGTGNWSVASGPATSVAQFSSTTNPTATFTPAGGTGSYVLTWTISNAPCPSSASSLTITVNAAAPVCPKSVTNVTTGETFCTIQAAIDAPNTVNGHTLNVGAATYDELVTVSKSLTINGQGASSVVTYTGSAIAITGAPGDVTPTLFKVTVPNVTIQNLTLNVDLSKIRSAIHTSGVATNLAVIGNVITPSGTPGANYGVRNAIAINPNLSNNGYTLANTGFGGVVVKGNTVNVSAGGIVNSFRAAVQIDLSSGVIGGSNAADGNRLTAINHDVISNFADQGNLTIQNNTCLGGGIQVSDPNPGAGTLTIANNTLDGSVVQPASGTLATGALMRIRNNGISGVKPFFIQNNTFQNLRWGISAENNGGITITGNTFTPNPAATDFRHISISSKLIASNSATLTDAQMQTLGGTLTGNTFNGASAPGSGTAIAFLNHRTAGAKFGSFTLGSGGSENTFASALGTFIQLDNSTGASTGYVLPFNEYAGIPSTTMGPWAQDYNIRSNRFDVGAGLQLPSTMSAAQRATLETKLFHKPDDASVGQLQYFDPVLNVTQNQSYSTIQSAIDAANANDVIQLAETIFNERATVTKPVTITGVSQTGTIIDGTGLAAGNGFTLQDNVAGISIGNLTIQKQTGSGNSTGDGIYGKTNNNLTITNVASVSNTTHGIILETSGTLTNVSVTSSTLSSNGIGNGGRGFIIFNNLKQNITVSNNLIQNNGLTGIDINEGTATGVSITGNTITGNGDEGVGLLGGLATGGANLISGNTITNNGRYGIEVKSSVGTGATSGAGSLVITNNIISRTTDLPGSRDIAGISVTRRGAGVSVNNVETPQGAVVQNNTVTGYINSDTGDGFGIVVEGINYQVTGNTVSNNEVGIQEQQTTIGQRGRTTGAPGDGDSSYDVSDYFDRGNSIYSCGVVTSNTSSGNTINTRAVGSSAGRRTLVTNTSTGSSYCTIQSAVDAATAGNSLSVGVGTFDELVTVNKALTIQGSGASSVVTYTGSAIAITGAPGDVTPTLFKVTAPNVTIQNLTLNVDLSKIRSAIHTSGVATNLAVIGNVITPSGTPGANYGVRNAIAINPNITNNGYTFANTGFGGVVVKGNTVNVSAGGIANSFRAAVQMDQGSGIIGGSTPADGNTFTSVNHDINVRFAIGPVTIQNNISLGGGIQFSEPNGAGSLITIANNSLTGATVQPTSGQLGTGALMRIQNRSAAVTLNVTGNTFTDYRWAMSVENFNTITLDGNTFTPRAGSTDYRSISFNTKLLASTSATIPPVTIGGTLTNNTFNGSGAVGGTGIAFFNHRQDGGTPTIGTFTLGTAGNENSFNAGIATFLRLDNSTGSSSGFNSPFGDYTVAGAPSTTMNYWTPDLNAVNNKFDVGTGLKLASSLSLTERGTLDGLLFDKNDDANVGRIIYYTPVRNVTQNTFFPTIQSAVDAATSGDVIAAAAGTYVENVTVTKSLTLLGANAGTNPNTGGRGAETIVLPATTGATDAAYPAALANIFSLSGNASNIVIDGFTLDGANPALSSQTTSTTINGVEIDAAAGVTGYGAQVTGGTVRNNIFRNFAYDGVDFGSDGAPTFNTITNNSFDNIAYVSVNTAAGVAVIVSDNGYASIINNVATRVRAGVQTNNFFQPSPGPVPTISGNNFTAYRYGIFHNLHSGSATGFTIAANTITGDAPLTGTTPLAGIAISSLQGAVPVTISGNTVNAGFPYGVEAWNTITTGAVTLSSGSIQGNTAGVRVTNRNRFGDAAGASKLSVSGVSITNSPVGVLVFDDPAAASGLTAMAIVTDNTQITGAATFTAVSIQGSDASADIVGNASSFIGNGLGSGVDVNGGTASVNANRITSFATGVNVSNGGQLTGAANNFITGNTNGIAYAANASAVQGVVTNNDLSANSGKAILNGLASITISANCNWYGTTNVDGQAASLFTGAVTYSPYLSSGTDNDNNSATGFQPVPGSCVSNTPPVASAIGNQTATVGVAYSFTVPAFSDSETPNSLSYTASIVPTNGFSFDPLTRIISGTPSMTGISTVTVTATDPGSLSANTTFTITVSPVACPQSVTNVNTGATFCTIQSAIDAPATVNGHTIRVGAGTYPEAVTVTKSLTLTGTNSGVAGFAGRVPESVIDGGGTRTGLFVSAANVAVDGFKFIGGQGVYGAAVAFNGPQSGVQIVNNIFTDNAVGVVEPSANAAIKHNLFDGNNRSGAAGGSGIYTDVVTNGLTVEDNEFRNHTTNSAVVFGASVSNTHQNLTFTKNYIHDNNAANSMVYSVAVNGGIFSQNTITQPGATALKFAGGNTSITVQNNFLDNNGVGVRVADDGYGLGNDTGIEVHNNSISNSSSRAIDNQEPATVNATCNWYGTTNVSAQAATLFSGAVTYSPYLSTGTDNEVGTPGFQPLPGSCTSLLTLTLTASPMMILTSQSTSLSAVVSGGVAPYTYTFSGPGTITQNGNTASVSGLTAGVQTFTVTVSDATMPASQTIATTVSVTVNAVNQAPVATANANQTATVGTAFSYTVNAFTDETPASLTYTASGLPTGLSFNASTRIISGTPSVTGVSTVSITATDPGSLTTSTSFTITVNPAPVVITSLTLVASANPTTILTTGTTTLSATVSGGTTPYSYTFSGPGTINPSGNTATVSGLTAGVQTFTVIASDATAPTSQTIATTVSVTVNAANQAPVATANANQTATVGTAFSYTVNAFTDETPASLVYTASGLPAGLSFNAGNRVISGTPSVTGVSTVSITATDPGSLSASTTFTITVSASAVIPTGPATLTITSFNCFSTNGALSSVNFVVGYSNGTFTPALPDLFINGVTITGKLGQPYTFNFDGNQSFLPIQDQATRTTYFVWDFRQACAGPVTPPSPTAPVAPSLPNQTATQGTPFSYVVPAFTGTAPIAYAASGLPAGLSFDASSRTISGTPSLTGVSTVVVSASNAAGQSSGQFTITVSGSATQPTGPATLTITSFNCFSTNGALSSVNFVVGYSNGTFTPALPNLFINGVTITGQLGQTYSFSGFDSNVTSLPVADNASRSTYFVWDFRQACAGPVTPPSPTAPVAPSLPNQTATQGTPFSYVVPAFTGTTPIAYAASGLPAGLSFDASSRTISGTPSLTGVSTVIISASNAAGQSSGQFTITVSASATQPTGPATLTITSFNCFSTNGALSSVNFVVGYSNGTFTPAVPNLFINGVTITGQLGQTYSFPLDANTGPLPIQDQATRSTYFVWDYRSACATQPLPTRLAAEGAVPLQLKVLGNPVSDQVTAEVRGAEGKALMLELVDAVGAIVEQRSIEKSGTTEQQRFDIHRQSAGMLLLRATTGEQTQTVKVLKK